MEEKADLKRAETELTRMLPQFNWQWTVLASTAGQLVGCGEKIPPEVLKLLTLARAKIASGCYTVCDITCDLRKIETELFLILLNKSPYEADTLLELLSKVMRGEIKKEDIDLKPIHQILPDCALLPCGCQ